MKEGKDLENLVEKQLRISNPSQPITVAQAFVEALINSGVEALFGISGGAILPTYDFLNKYQGKLREYLMNHEQGAGHAAEGYAQASGKVGVCIATSGPGATNLTTALNDAKMDSYSILAITGQVPSHLIGTDAFQEAPVFNIFSNITRHNYLVRDEQQLVRIVKEALYLSRNNRPCPVAIDIPKDIQQKTILPDYNVDISIKEQNSNINVVEKSSFQLDHDQIEMAAKLIKESKRPVIYAGGGIIHSDATKELSDFVEQTNIPVTMTLKGLGCYPYNENNIGFLGMHGNIAANYTLNLADSIIAIGTRFDDRVTGKVSGFAPYAKVIHIDIDKSEIGKVRRADIPIHSDAKTALLELNDIVTRNDCKEWWQQIREWQEKYPLTYEDRDDVIMPQYLVDELSKITDNNAICTTGVGAHQMWFAQHYKVKRPRQLITSGGAGTMGFGLPAAIGAKIAKPQDLVIDFDGDGSLNMTIGELKTLKLYDIPVKIVVANNRCLGMVKIWQDLIYNSNYSGIFTGDVEFAKVAEGYGIAGRKITEKKDLFNGLVEMIEHKGPYLLDVRILEDEHVYPFVPAGGSFRKMYLGKDKELIFNENDLLIKL